MPPDGVSRVLPWQPATSRHLPPRQARAARASPLIAAQTNDAWQRPRRRIPRAPISRLRAVAEFGGTRELFGPLRYQCVDRSRTNRTSTRPRHRAETWHPSPEAATARPAPMASTQGSRTPSAFGQGTPDRGPQLVRPPRAVENFQKMDSIQRCGFRRWTVSRFGKRGVRLCKRDGGELNIRTGDLRARRRFPPMLGFTSNAGP
jgi:hypothetical protein